MSYKYLVCNLIRTGIAALFGPQDPMLSAHVQSICATLEIPHIAARWELEPPFRQSTINLYPSYSVLNHAFADIVDHWKWRSLVILYEDQFGTSFHSEILFKKKIYAKKGLIEEFLKLKV
jgi:glutamate receptor, ionotropic, invertebrate